MSDILLALWFFLPVGPANMAPIIAAKIPWLAGMNAPMDLGRTFRGKRILGANKTWRGLLAGMIFATLTLWLQQKLAGQAGWIADFPGVQTYAQLPTLLLGPLFALGTLGGDALKSFIKRQLDAAPGKPWLIADQIGEITGAILITLPFVQFGPRVYMGVVVIWVVVDVAVSAAAYLVGFKERPI